MANCEICKLSLKENEGFIVNTSQLVSEPSFWEGRFTEVMLGLRRKFRDDIPRMEADKKFKYSILKECHIDTGRLICSGCMSNFTCIDIDEASRFAGEFWKMEDKTNYRNSKTGTASVEEAVKIAGPIWKRMSGKEPPVVKDNREPEKSLQKGCFIATACYEDFDCKEVRILRSFRDEYMETSLIGSFLIRVYYVISPPVACFIGNNPGLKSFISKVILPPIIEMINSISEKRRSDIQVYRISE